MSASPPFGPSSRTGFELELLAPRGRSRAAVARAFAEALGGRVVQGFKYHGGGRHDDGRRICHLSPRWSVVDAQGQPLLDLVDDITLRRDLQRDAGRDPDLGRLITDDLRIATWIERRCETDGDAQFCALEPLLDGFDASLGEPGQHGVKRPEQRAVIDPQGHILCVLTPAEIEPLRVCELVTRPLSRAERLAVLENIVRIAERLELEIPHEAALHMHIDAEPWQHTGPLCRLLHYAIRSRDSLHETFATNPACRRLRPLGDDVSALVNETWQHLRAGAAAPPFADFALELRDTGINKFTDVNVMGAILEHPRQPTVELRFLPMSLDLDHVQAMIEQCESLLADLWSAAIAG